MMIDTNMLSTNDINTIAQSVGTAVGGFVSEIVSGILIVVIPFMIQLWRKSRIKSAVINALVRGVENSKQDISSDDTAFVKKAIRTEAVDAGVQQHVDKAVKEVTTKMAEEKADAQATKGDGI